jgi:hypothetical protein
MLKNVTFVLAVLVVVLPCLVGWLTLKYNERQRPATPSTVFNRVYAYLPDDVDRVAEAIYPTLLARSGVTPAGLRNAARAAYEQAEGLVAYKNERKR